MAFRRRMRSLPLSQVRLQDRFWSRWQRVVSETTLLHEFAQIEETGRLANFRRAAGHEEGEFEGLWFNDSDVYKWVEACAYVLAVQPNAKLRQRVDETVEAIVAAQQPDGYINTFFQLKHPHLKWRNLHTMHEMYCGGHLIEAGVAMAEALGDKRLLDTSLRFADHVMSIFGPEGRKGYCGHQEIELALIRLAEATGQKKYREFARWMVEQRGSRPAVFDAELEDEESLQLSPWAKETLRPGGEYCGDYAQDHAPIREHTQVVGHAVRAMYYYIAAADLAGDQADEALETALVRVWENLTKRRMYVTGGIGPSAHNEGFTTDYDLPNLTSYAETCAAIGLVFWGHRMLEMTGDGTYADVMERALFNGSISGMNLAGDRFFYANPHESRGTHERVPWFGCACCPPNIARMIGNVTSYLVGASSDELYIHVPAALTAKANLGGQSVTVRIEGDYPWSGEFRVVVETPQPVDFALCIRIPGWADDIGVEVEGADEEADYETGYMVLRRTWRNGDTVKVDYEMSPKWVESDPKVRDNLGRVALTNGPIVYTAEAVDLGYAPQLLSVDTEAEATVEATDELGGVNSITVEGQMELEPFVDDLYAEVGTADVRETTAKLIPYYAWANRGKTAMQVWLRRL